MSRRRHFAVGALLVVSVLMVWGCGGAVAPPNDDGDGNGGGDGTSGVPTSAPAAQAAQQVAARHRQIVADSGWPGGAAEFLVYAQARPDVLRASVDGFTGDASVIYQGNVAHILHAPHPGGDEADLSGLVAAASAREPESAAVRWFPSQETPRATAATSHTNEEGRVVLRQLLGRVLECCERAGYQTPETVPSCEREWFRSWPNYGIIYFAGHGGWGDWIHEDGEVTHRFAMQTDYSWDIHEVWDAAFDEDIFAGRLVVFNTSDSDVQALAVTSAFLRHYCDPLAPHAIVYLMSCNGLTYFTDMASTLTDLGAEVVYGWNGLAPRDNGNAWGLYFFDRLCGGNLVDPQSPPVRAHTDQDVHAYMLSRGWNRFTWEDGTHSQLVSYRNPTADEQTGARPVISGGVYHATNDRDRPEVWLNGYFGPSRGRVRIGSTDLTIRQWLPYLIQAEFPAGSDDTVGDVIVEVNHLPSIPLRLTRFTGSVDLDVDRPGRYEGYVQANFSGRGLVQLMRPDIGEEPVTMPTPSGNCLVDMDEWEMSWSISGEWDQTDGLGRPVHYVLDASGLKDSDSDPSDFIHAFQIDLDAHSVRRRLTLDVEGTLTRTDHTGTSTDTWSAGYETGGLTPSLPLPDTWVLPETTATDEDATFRWTPVTPDPAAPAADAYPASMGL